MLRNYIIKVALVLLIFMSAVIWADNDLVITILQMALPFAITQKFVRLLYYRQRLTHIYESFIMIFQMPTGDHQTNLLLHNSMTYDATHAWASIKLPTKIYKKMNLKLTPGRVGQAASEKTSSKSAGRPFPSFNIACTNVPIPK